jgi:hypothetical protein
MGKGVSFMEDDFKWHGMPPSVEQAEKAMRDLGTTLGAWTQRLESHVEALVAPGPNGVR